MKRFTVIAVLLMVYSLSGCAHKLNSVQEMEYQQWKMAGVLIEEKDPNTGMVLGLLPGGGSFYAREPALGVINLLLWPFSILWDPISGYDGAKVINYNMTKFYLNRKKPVKINLTPRGVQ